MCGHCGAALLEFLESKRFLDGNQWPLVRPGNQPWWGFYACEEQAVSKGSGEMELIPRPWVLDLLPLVYTVAIESLVWYISWRQGWTGPLFWFQDSSLYPLLCSLLGWEAAGAMHMYLAASSHWPPGPTLVSLRTCMGHLLWEYAQMKGFPVWLPWTKTAVGERPLEKWLLPYSSSGCVSSSWLLFCRGTF